MICILKFWVFCLVACWISNPLFSQSTTVATYNIRYDGHTDLANDWSERKVPISQYVLKNEIDIIGFQEVLINQLDDLSSLLPSYKDVGVGRDDGIDKGEFSPIFYDTTKFDLLRSGTFWLSPTPNIPSKGWDAALNRICTYALFENKLNSELTWVFNTHFDHVGIEARFQSSELILDQIAANLQEKDAPVLLLGDFNMEPTDQGIQLIQSQLRDLSCSLRHPELCSENTFNAFTSSPLDDKRIDYLFGSSNILTRSSVVDKQTFGLSYPSDHFPLLITFQILK
jgi:endonuclease/exonuclease/phosphatase family metal-dependent hydrolase